MLVPQNINEAVKHLIGRSESDFTKQEWRDIEKKMELEERIYNIWDIKIRTIFKKYINKKHLTEEDIEDCKNIWWMKIVEPGWTSDIIEKYQEKYDDYGVLSYEDTTINTILDRVGLPTEIIE